LGAAERESTLNSFPPGRKEAEEVGQKKIEGLIGTERNCFTIPLH